jgi:peroxiredoxin
MRSDIVPGSLFPHYELTDHTAKRRKLSELQGPHPMVLVLSRGAFCPKDRRQAELLVQLHREMEVGYCRLVTISSDNITVTNEYRTGVGAHWPFLSDAGRVVQKDLDIAEYTDPANNPMIPNVIVLEPVVDLISTLTEWGREYLPYEPNRTPKEVRLPAPRIPNPN